MIRANELRIGNWILVNEKPMIVNTVYYEPLMKKAIVNVVEKLGDVPIVPIGNITSSIPLTEEILLKCGFSEVGMFNNVYHKDNFRIIIGHKQNCLFQIHKDEHCVGIEISSLHQLQNLYFVLTNKELEIEL